MNESGGQIDLLVLGGGMAGLSAAAYACEQGASVVLVEKAADARRLGAVRAVHPHGADAGRHARGQPRRRPEARGSAGRGLRGGTRLGALTRRPRRRSDLGPRLQPRLAAPTWRTICWRASAWSASTASCCTDATAERLLVEDGAVTGAVIRTAERRAHRPRALDAAGHRRLRRRSRAARAAHPPARARPPAAREHPQHRRRPAAGSAHRGRLRTAGRRLLRASDPVARRRTRTRSSSSS